MKELIIYQKGDGIEATLWDDAKPGIIDQKYFSRKQFQQYAINNPNQFIYAVSKTSMINDMLNYISKKKLEAEKK